MNLGKVQGHWEGYMAGYEDSRHYSVHEMTGVKPEEEKDLNERALEMEVDEGVIERLDESQES